MKTNLNHFILFSLTILSGLLIEVPAYSQDENDPTAAEFKDPNLTPDPTAAEERPAATEHDRSLKLHDSRDSSHSRASAILIQKSRSTDQAKPSASKDEDALSFNFLYYIIQKFKISDLVDE